MSLLDITIGDEAPDVINVVVEIPKNSHNKYELDDKTGIFKLDRVLHPPLFYPADYGFIPQTCAKDGDHLDALILNDEPTFSGCVVKVRPIGLLKMVDSGEEDCKVLAVQADNPNYKNINNVEDISDGSNKILEQISHFFRVYKGPEEKEVVIVGWEDADSAKEEIRKAQEFFKKKA